MQFSVREEKCQKISRWQNCTWKVFLQKTGGMAKGTSKALWRGVHRLGGNKRSSREKNCMLVEERKSAIYRGRTQRRDHSRPGFASQGQTEWQQGQWTRKHDRQWDDQKVSHEEYLHYSDVSSRTVHGPYGISKLVEGCKTRVLKETGCSPDCRNHELPGNRFDVSNV